MSADNLKVWFPIKRGLLRSTVGHIKAVDGVSIAVRKGETLGVVGESGSGKTTLGLALLRLISSDGPIVFLGSNIQGLRFKDMLPFRRDMQIVFQDPFGALSPRMSVGDIVAEGLSVHQTSLSYEEREARVVKALQDVGLDPETRFRYPHEFSGGQRQRISIARAVVLEPNFVVLDEPTSALDMLFQAQMVDLLRELQRKRDLTYMFISHDLRVVASLASHLIVMRHGKVVEEGPAAELFKNPKSDYTRALFAAAFRIEAVPDGATDRAVIPRRRIQYAAASRFDDDALEYWITRFARSNDVELRLQPLDRRDLAAGRLDPRDRLARVLDHRRHVMRVGVHDGVGIAHDRDVALPEDQVAALQLLRLRSTQAPGRGRPAACRCRAGSRCRRRSARPGPGRSNRCRGCSCRPRDRACRRSVRRPRRNPSPSRRGCRHAVAADTSLRASRRTRRLRGQP